MSQPAVSAALKALEDDLAVTLFERPTGSRAVRPTAAALKLYKHARDILSRCEAARASVTAPDERAPKLRLGVLQTLAAAAIAAAHAHLNRSADLWRWSVKEGSADALAEGLSEGRIDIAWTAVGAGAVQATVLWHEPYVAMVSKHHAVAKSGRPSVSVSDISGEPFILRGRCELRRFAFRDAGLTIKPVARAERDELALAMVAEGLGIAIAPRSLATADVAALTVDDLGLSRPIGLIWRDETPPAAVDRVVAALTGR